MKVNNTGGYSAGRNLHAKKNSGDLTRQIRADLTCALRQYQQKTEHVFDPLRVRIIRGHHNWMAVAYAYSVCCFRLKDSQGWQEAWVSPRMESLVCRVALNAKFGSQSIEKMLAAALSNHSIHLWALGERGDSDAKIGVFSLNIGVDSLFFIGSQLVGLSESGKIGIWHSMTGNWQVQDVVPICSYDTAGSFLLLGCENGSIYYIDMQKFPLRMKDNDLLVTELYRDPSADLITAISVYLTPKTNLCGNWIEIAYGTSSGLVRVIVQHPETVGHGPQLFQTFTVHQTPITKVALTTTHLISVCSEYNHVRTWSVTRFRGMISTQPGSTPVASFKVLTLESTNRHLEADSSDAGPFGDQDGEQLFIQKIVPETDQLFVRLASNGDRVCVIRSVDGSVITSYLVHECEGSNRMGSRPRRYLFSGHANGSIQMWDLTTGQDLYFKKKEAAGSRPLPTGPTPEELLHLIDECEITTNSLSTTPSTTPTASNLHIPSLFQH